jgi:hypothetical protein
MKGLIMSENITPTSQPAANNYLVIMLGIVAALLVFAVLTNRPIPFISTDRGAMILLVIVGMSMCAMGGIGPTVANYGWTSPLAIVGIVLGILMLLIPGAVLVGVHLPLITTEREAIVALTILGIIKIFINIAYGLLVAKAG